MAGEVGTAYVGVELDPAGVKAGLKRVQGDATKGFSSIGSKAGKAFKVGLTAGIAGLGVAALGIKSVTNAASDLNESVNAVTVTFGKASKQVLEFSEKAATEAGLSMREFNELVTPVGASLQNFGFSAEEAATASIDLASRAADMASVFNTDVSEALGAIQAGLRGEADPLERFGVGLSDAAVKAKAMALGLAESEKALTAQDKAQARVALLMEQTNRLAGDFKNTSDGLANAQRVIAAEFENIKAKIGSAFLPYIARGAAAVAGFLGEFDKAKGASAKFRVVVDSIKTAAGELFDAVRGAIAKVDWAAAWGDAKGFASGFGDAITDALGEVDWAGVGSAIGDGIRTAIDLSLPAIQGVLTKVVEAARKINWVDLGVAMGPGLAAAVASAIKTALDPVFWIKNWELTLAIAGAVFTRGLGAFGVKLAPIFVRLGEGMVIRIAAGISEAFPRLGAIFLALFMRLPSILVRGFQAVERAVAGLFGRLGKLAVFTVRVLGIQAAVQAITSFVQGVGRKLGELAGIIARVASDAYGWAVDIGAEIVNGILAGIVSLPARLGEKLGGMVKSGVDWAKGHVGSTADEYAAANIGAPLVAGAVRGIILGQQALSTAVAESVRNAVDAGRAEIEAQRARFQAAWGTLSGDVLAAFDAIQGAIKTKAEKTLAAMELKRQAAQLTEALNTALDAVQQAKAEQAALAPREDEDPAAFAERQRAAAKAVTDAEKQETDARYAIRVAELEKQAAVQRRERDARVALRRRHFEEDLTALQNRLQREGASEAESRTAILRLMRAYDVKYKAAGNVLGKAFVTGMQEALEGATETLARLLERVKEALEDVRRLNAQVTPPKKGGAKSAGPPPAPALAGLAAPAPAAAGGGGGLAGPIPLGARLRGALPRLEPVTVQPAEFEVRVYIGDQELRGLVRTELVDSNTGLARALLAGGKA